MEYRVGTSGWHYDHWQGRFYPERLHRPRWLEYYSQYFDTVELNNSFYRLPSEAAFVHWREVTPQGFCFAVKVSRLITHLKKLRNVAQPLESFLERARLLEAKLGPLLYQIPPSLHRQDELLEEFIRGLPPGLEHVFEFRHESWLCPEVLAILERHKAGFCIFDMPGASCPVVATANFAYIRFHGSTGLYSSCYSDEELAVWARRIRGLGVSRAYAYFNNDAHAFAVRNAQTLRGQLERPS